PLGSNIAHWPASLKWMSNDSSLSNSRDNTLARRPADTRVAPISGSRSPIGESRSNFGSVLSIDVRRLPARCSAVYRQAVSTSGSSGTMGFARWRGRLAHPLRRLDRDLDAL